MHPRALLLFAAAVAGCSAARAPAEVAQTGRTSEAMVGGTVSTTSQNSVVFVMKGEDESCSGTLIAPNLVLTARHCVATPDDSADTECVGYGATVTPSTMTIKTGASSNWDVGEVAATGQQIFVPDTLNMCSFDVALILLDRDVAGAKVSPVRFTPITNGEPVTAVGYGVDENNDDLPNRMQRNTSILGVGPAAVAYKEQDGTTFNYNAPDGDVVTGESTCFGDSGGPLFDAKGAVVAMTSRGPLNSPEDGDHGSTGCGDMVSIYSGARKNEDLIRKAAIAAGHPLPAADTGTTAQSSSTGVGDDDDGSSTNAADSGDDDDSTATTSTKKKKSSSSSSSADASEDPIASSGCSAAPNARGSGAESWLLILGAALVSSRKRRSPG